MAVLRPEERNLRAFGPLGVVLGVLLASNLVANLVVPDWAYVPWNMAVTVVVVSIAIRRDGESTASMGLSRRRLGAGLALGGAVSAVLAAVMVAGLLIPATRDVFMDDRADVPFWEMAYKVFIEVPLGTVLLEEVAFRGVLPAMVAKRVEHGPRSQLTADAVAAVLFGLWHILPSLSLGDANDEIAQGVDPLALQVGGVVVSVVVTAVVAMGLSWMRNRSDSVAAPAVLHATSNSLGSALAWIAQRVL
ncbi:MAG: CPBP family intramembrane metalloprotease [Microthrixaceae bacterium]|nr:CPBP family intramembrane metalloprotease [Microthrixaceae bacterium]MCO5317799.1 CPBP family intramembrane metalloprotease [Microthrixaceae bacterium]